MPYATRTLKGVDVSYPTRETQQSITNAEYELICNMSEHKVAMIKFIHGQYGLGLYEAKQIVDTVILCGKTALL